MLNRRLFVAAMVVSLSTSSLSLAADKAVDPRALFETKCSECHSTSVPRAQRLSKKEWTDILAIMRRNGCDISDKEAGILVEFLSKEYGK